VEGRFGEPSHDRSARTGRTVRSELPVAPRTP